MKKIRTRLTYANVAASLALFIALASGTAYAANELGKESIGTKQLAKEAVTPAKLSKSSKKALKGARGPKGATGARGATGQKGSTGMQGARGPEGRQGSAGPRGLPGENATNLWVAVNIEEGAERGKGVEIAEPIATGKWLVTFERNVSTCGFEVTTGSIKPSTEALAGLAGAAPSTTDPDAVVVWTANGSGAFKNYDFYLAVFC
jgi:Collagen triple helix repeat (20 copies)